MEDGDFLSFLGDGYEPDHRVRALILEPGDAIDFEPADRSDTVVVVEHGHLQIESAQASEFEHCARSASRLRRRHNFARRQRRVPAKAGE
jgi:hypothetical protein